MMCMVEGADCSQIFNSESWHRARKAHRCCECGREIVVGERYRYCAIKDYEYSGVDSYHTCAGCAVVEDWLRAECRGWLFGGVDEDLAGHLTYGPWSADEERQTFRVTRPARLLVGMRRRWRRFDGAGLMEI